MESSIGVANEHDGQLLHVVNSVNKYNHVNVEVYEQESSAWRQGVAVEAVDVDSDGPSGDSTS